MKRCLIALLALLYPFAAFADGTIAKAEYPAGPLWYKDKLYYAELVQDRIMVSNTLQTGQFWASKGCGPSSVAPYGDGMLVVCYMRQSLERVSANGENLGTIDRDDAGERLVHPTGSSADSKGGVYITASGEFSLAAPATGAILYLDKGGALHRLVEGLRYPSGIVIDEARHRLLVSEQLNRRVLAFPMAADGKLMRPKTLLDVSRSVRGAIVPDPLDGPDGLALDAATGHLLVAEYGEGRLHLLAADGSWQGVASTSMRFVTGVALLGDGRAVITEATTNSVAPYPGDVVLASEILHRFVKP